MRGFEGLKDVPSLIDVPSLVFHHLAAAALQTIVSNVVKDILSLWSTRLLYRDAPQALLIRECLNVAIPTIQLFNFDRRFIVQKVDTDSTTCSISDLIFVGDILFLRRHGLHEVSFDLGGEQLITDQ